MTANLTAQGPYLSVLLNTHLPQQLALINSATLEQENILLEILLNILKLEHENKDKKFIKTKLRFLRNFDRNKSLKIRKKYLKKHKKKVIQILNYFKNKLLTLL